jgi:hypothetical protein
VLDNGVAAVRVPAACRCAPAAGEEQELPAPVLAVRLPDGTWCGSGRLRVSAPAPVEAIEFETLAEGPLFCLYAVTYRSGERAYRVEYRLEKDSSWVRLRETSSLCHDAAWTLDLYPGLAPLRGAYHNNRRGWRGALEPLRYDGTQHIGDVQAPENVVHYFEDDFEAFAALGEEQAVAVAAAEAGAWTYLPDNPIHVRPQQGPRLVLEASAKAGERRWGLHAGAAAAFEEEWFFDTPPGRFLRRTETRLDQVKEMTLAWEDVDDRARPVAACTAEDLERAQALFANDPAFKAYGEFLDPEAPLDIGQYDAGRHYVLDEERRGDAMSAWLGRRDPAIARILVDGLLAGLRDRVEGFLGPAGHRAPRLGAISLGRLLRPFAQMYDIIAPHAEMTGEERRWIQAAMAFLAYKANDPNYWDSEAMVRHAQHPKSAHRNAWFPGRESDWTTYNIDTTPHNFHIDLYTAAACMAMTFPQHPMSDAWVEKAVQFTEQELDNWISPDGAFVESATYTMATLHWWVPYFAGLKNTRRRNYFLDERLQRLGYCLARVLGPYDRRLQRHSFVVMGDAMYPANAGDVLAWLAHLGREDAGFAAAMMGAWERTCRQLNNPGAQGVSMYDALYIDPSLPAEPLAGLPSEHIRDLGLILRHHHGREDEVYFFIKCGKIYSHFHYDEGAFFVFADGVPLLDEYGVQYGKGTNSAGEEVGTHFPPLHNGITFSEAPDNREIYNRGRVTQFVPTPWADYAVCEMPVHLLYYTEGTGLWGFTGEEAPSGWWRRHILFVKPHGFFFYDEVESPFVASLDLNLKADAYETIEGLSRLYRGRYGTDIPVCINAPRQAPVREDRITVHPKTGTFSPRGNTPAVPEAVQKDFYHQVSMHVQTGPDTDYSWAFAWARPEAQPRLLPLEGSPGSELRMADRTVRAVVTPWLQEAHAHRDEAWTYRGWAGALQRLDGATELLQLRGSHIGIPGGASVDGDGPFRLRLGDRPVLEVDGQARWLTLRGVGSVTPTLDGAPCPVEPVAGGVRFSVPGGAHRLELD